MAEGRRVLIIGGGVAGLCAALALRRVGVAVEIAEIDPRWAFDDFGVIVHSNFIRAMAALGVASEAVALGFPYHGIELLDLAGNSVGHIESVRLAGAEYPSELGMSMPSLHKVLASAALAAGADVRLGVTFRELRQHPDRVSVTFTDGSVGSYDLVVGADGVHSGVRSVVFGEHLEPHATGYFRWRCKVPRPKALIRALSCAGLPGRGRCGFLPLTASTGCVTMLVREPPGAFYSQDELADVARQHLADCDGVMGQLRDSITDSSKVVCRPLELLMVPAPWYRGRVLLIGDAAHAMSAHLAQGAAQAAEDGVVLGELMGQGLSVPQVLNSFMERRFSRCCALAEAAAQVDQWVGRWGSEEEVAMVTRRMMEITSDAM